MCNLGSLAWALHSSRLLKMFVVVVDRLSLSNFLNLSFFNCEQSNFVALVMKFGRGPYCKKLFRYMFLLGQLQPAS
jgi:hypothetical protein